MQLMKKNYNFLGKPNNFANREKTQSFFPNKNIVQPLQVHGKKIVKIGNKNSNEKFEADGVWTQEKNIMLSIKTADCIGLLFYNEKEDIIAAVHAGWRGLAQKISTEFLFQFPEKIRKNFHVFLSPSLQKCCSQFSDPYNETPDFFHKYIEKREEKFFIDLSEICEQELMNCGIKKENIHNNKICTKCSENWWSHRNGEKERNLSWIEMI